VSLPETHELAKRLLADPAVSLDQARAEIIAHVAGEGDANPTSPQVRVEVGEGEGQKRAVAMRDAILHRAMPDRFKLTDGAREFMGFRLAGLARIALEDARIPTRGLSELTIVQRALRLKTEQGPDLYQ